MAFKVKGVWMEKRPLDVLNHAKGKRVVLMLKNTRTISGVLQALDIHLNMWLNEAEITEKIRSEDGTESEKITKFGKMLVRGDSIVYASPAE